MGMEVASRGHKGAEAEAPAPVYLPLRFDLHQSALKGSGGEVQNSWELKMWSDLVGFGRIYSGMGAGADDRSVLEKFLPGGGGISKFQAYKRSKPHFTEVFSFSKRSKRACCYAWKSEFRLVFNEVATLVRLARNGGEKSSDFCKNGWKIGGIKNDSRRDRKIADTKMGMGECRNLKLTLYKRKRRQRSGATL